MPGPAPSTSPDRERKPQRDLPWVDLPADADLEVPDPPAGLSDRGREWWAGAWSSPSATQWTDAGYVSQVVRRAELEDAWGSTKDPKYLAEMRHLESALGLTAKARKELRWRIVDGPVLVEVNGVSAVDELAARRAPKAS